MKIALVGNPNSGKTTLFNKLTRQNQKVGNWSGVTVERKTGKYYKDKNIEIIDLPGVYSLTPISADEKVTVNYLKNGKPDLIIQTVDSTLIERSLALTLQLSENKTPVVLAMNMQDELKQSGVVLDYEIMEKEIGCPCIPIFARSGKGIHILMEHVVKKILSERACGNLDGGKEKNEQKGFESIGITEEEKTEFRHKYILEKVKLFKKTTEFKRHTFTDKIDRIILNKWLAFPIFAFIIWLMYFVSVQTVGALCIDGLETLFFDIIGENVRKGLINIGASDWVTMLTVDGIIAGVGAVLIFIPQIVILFLFITFLEGCGYMARVAVIMDRLFRKLGLSGKSFIPMIVGCGCSVPAIMSAKTIANERERKATIMLTPFIPCSAKLPVFAFIAGILFPHNFFIAPSMYFLGIFMIILGGLFLKLFSREKYSEDMLIIEMPHYRLPAASNILKELWDKTKGFVIRASVIILPAVIILWFLQSFNFAMRQVDIQNSMLATIGRGISWIFHPLGFGNWESAIALLSGTVAKETVVATFGVILGGDDISLGLSELFTPQAAYAFMAFILLSAPCIAAIAATRKELGQRNMWLAIVFQFAVAYTVAMIINQIGNLFAYNSEVAISIIAGIIIFLIFGLSILYYIKNRKKRKQSCSYGCSSCSKAKDCGKIKE